MKTWQKLCFTLLAVCLGAVNLGGGLSAGHYVANYFLPDQTAAEITAEEKEILPVFSFENETPVFMPIQVQGNDFADIVRSAGESVVSINVIATIQTWFGGIREAEGAGSGFIFSVDDKGVYIATNNHVIEDVNAVSISLDDDESVEATVVGRDRDSDLAVLYVSKSVMDGLGVPYKAAKIGDSDSMRVGDSVVAIGNAMGEGQSATSGIISAVNRQITVERRTLNVMQTDAAINQGNSGGPLVNAGGEVIAINTAKLFASGVDGMGYSLPINEALKILSELLEDGTTEKPYLGIQYMVIDEASKDAYNLPSACVLIRSVAEGGPAQAAGIIPWDILTAFNGHEIKDDEDLRNSLTACKVGDTVQAEVIRGNEILSLTIKIGNMNTR